MDNRQILQQYVNDFRRHISPFLRPSVGVACVVYPALDPGALLEFTMGLGIASEDRIKDTVPTVNVALAAVEQRAFGGNLAGFRFSGTNVIGEGNRIIIIKGEDSLSYWSNEAALQDVLKIINRPKTVGEMK